MGKIWCCAKVCREAFRLDSKRAGAGGRPAICTPVVGRNEEEIFSQLSCVLGQKPDIVEWRADFFADIADTHRVLAVAEKFACAAGSTPVIFTIRSVAEGGQPIALSARERICLNAAVCSGTAIEYIDCELSNEPADIEFLRGIAHGSGKKIIGSFHEFSCTPGRDSLLQKFLEAQSYGLDVAKVAVMPQDMEDVLTLLGAALEAKKRLSIPLIAIALGHYGAITRMIGGVFGSSVSFAVGHTASAPGQVPIDDLRTVFSILDQYY